MVTRLLPAITDCIVQDVPATCDPVDQCRFAYIDQKSVLVSESERTLRYFEKSWSCRVSMNDVPDPAMTPRPHLVCPHCGSDWVMPIVYGLPGDELLEMATQGYVALGGCTVDGSESMWSCNCCHHE